MKKKVRLLKSDGQWKFPNQELVDQWSEWLREAGENEHVKSVDFIMEIKRKKRTIDANNYYWGFVNKAIAEHLDIDPKTLHYRYMLPWFGLQSIEKERKNHFKILDENGIENDYFGKGSSQMNSKEFFDFVERVRKWASGPSDPGGVVSKHYGLELYIPDPNGAEKYYQQHAEII